MTAKTVSVQFSSTGTPGSSPSECVELLGIRPLLVGTAWKVLDLLLETALGLAGEVGDGRDGTWTIKRKVEHANTLIARPANLAPLAWEALMRTYAKTEDLRNSLVHRTVYADTSGALVGVDRAGRQITPVTPDEQEALGRAVLRAAQLVTAAQPDNRVTADLIRQLGYLVGVHGVALPAVALVDSLPQITVIIDPDPATPGRYTLDASEVRALAPFDGLVYADLVVQLRDRPGQDLQGHLELAPDEARAIDPAAPPDWLS
jgi:hypothetical protein